jgi:hypothetical protein
LGTTSTAKSASRSCSARSSSRSAAGRERLVHLLAELVGHLAGAVGERHLHLARDLVELVLDELRVGAGLLAVEHARADLHGVGDHLDRVVARLLALADQPDRHFVGDHQAVDRQPVTDGPDVRLA